MSLSGESNLNLPQSEHRTRGFRRLIAIGTVAALLAACTSDEAESSTQETRSTQSTSTTTSLPVEISTTTTISPEVANAAEQFIFAEKMKLFKVQLAQRIIDALNSNQGNSANYFFEFDNNEEEDLPDGYGVINVFIDVPAEGTLVGKYSLTAKLVKNIDGSFDLSTLEDIHISKYIYQIGTDGLLSDRLHIESISINGDVWLEHSVGPDTNNLNNFVYVNDVKSRDGSTDRLNVAYISAIKIINEALARNPVSA